MSLIRNVAGVHKLGLVDYDMYRALPEENGGGGGYTDPVYQPGGPEITDYNPKDGYTPPDVINPDGADTIDMSDIQPVYPIEPIYGYEETPDPAQQPVNTVSLAETPQQRAVDITAIGALASVLFMAIGYKPKGVLGGIAYAGSLGLLWMQLHYQTPGAGNEPVKQ